MVRNFTYGCLVIVCSVVATSRASAAIPDANGVFHGCYNILSGSVRIIDGTYCGLFERHVAWQQTGIAGPVGPQGPAGQSVTGESLDVGDAHCPTGGVALTLASATTYVCNGAQGPQGPQGPEGPQGPPGDSGVLVNYGKLHPSLPYQPFSDALTFASDEKFTASGNGKCIVYATGFIADDGTPRVEMFITYKRNTSTITLLSERAELNGPSIMQGATVAGIDIQAGNTYEFGVTFKSYEDGVSQVATAFATVAWTCQYQ